MTNESDPEVPAEVPVSVSNPNMDMTKPELVAMAEATGVDASGTKADIIESLSALPQVPEELKQYFVGYWSGQFPLYQCPHCAFDTMNEDAIEPHIAQTHPTAWMEEE
jgi:hypothetical protein